MSTEPSIETVQPPPDPRPGRRLYLWFELILFFAVVPCVLYVGVTERIPVLRSPILMVVIVFVACLVYLLMDPRFDRRELWNWRPVLRVWPWMLARFVAGGAVLIAFMLLYDPDRWLMLPRQAPELWVMIMVLYPLVSVYPQELIYRPFFFHRYREILRRPAAMILANALAFGFVHIVMRHWIAPAVCTVGGLIFAYSYWRNRSTCITCIEHALFGDLIFTIGLGWYFYAGAGR